MRCLSGVRKGRVASFVVRCIVVGPSAFSAALTSSGFGKATVGNSGSASTCPSHQWPQQSPVVGHGWVLSRPIRSTHGIDRGRRQTGKLCAAGVSERISCTVGTQVRMALVVAALPVPLLESASEGQSFPSPCAPTCGRTIAPKAGLSRQPATQTYSVASEATIARERCCGTVCAALAGYL